MTSNTSVFTGIRAEIARRRTDLHVSRLVRAQRRELARDLAPYRTEADRLDLQATLQLYPAEATSEIRTILSRQAAEIEAVTLVQQRRTD